MSQGRLGQDERMLVDPKPVTMLMVVKERRGAVHT